MLLGSIQQDYLKDEYSTGDQTIVLGKVSRGKTAILLGFVQITSTPPPKGQLVQLFSEVKIQDLKISLGLRIIYSIHYTNSTSKTV